MHVIEAGCITYNKVTLFALVFCLNCTALSRSESSNFFLYIINAGIPKFAKL